MEKQLEHRLREAGNSLHHFPSQLDQLLPLLDEVENLLEKVDQSPSGSIQNAYSKIMHALLAEPLLRHSDSDVQVSVASCISEITRITAPEAPYDDDRMKEVFQLIVSSFADLSDKSSRSYEKRASILETVAKIRSCVVMLDLECDELISKMFQHFIRSIRDDHPKNIFESMETIMTVVLEESEDVSMDLLMPILSTLRRDNEEIPFVARRLGESVFANCAVKLKPFLKQAVKSSGLSLDDYSKIVTTICNGANSEVAHEEGNVLVEQLAEESKITTSSDGMPQDAKELVPEQACCEEVPKKPDENNLSIEPLNANVNKVDKDDLDTGNLGKVDTTQERTAKKRGRKPCSTKPSEPLRIDSDKEIEIICQKASDEEADRSPGLGKDAHISLYEDPHVSPDKEELPLSPAELLDSEANVSLSPSKSLPDESPPKKAGVSKRKYTLAQELASVDSALKEAIDGTSGMEVKPETHFETKKLNLDKEDALSMDSAPEEAADVNSDSEIKPQKRFGKKENFDQEHQSANNLCAVISAAADGGSDSEIKAEELPRKNEGDSGQEDEPPENLMIPKLSDGSNDSEKPSGEEKVKLAQDGEPVPQKVDDENSDFKDIPQRRSGKKAVRTKKATSCVTKRNMLKGSGTSKTDTEDDSDEEEELTQSAKEGGESQLGKDITSGRRGRPPKKSGKVDVSETKLSDKKHETSNEGNRSDTQTDGDGSSSGKEKTRSPMRQPLKKSSKGYVSEAKLSDKKHETSNEGNRSDTQTDGEGSSSGKEKTRSPMRQPLKKSSKGYVSEAKLPGKKEDKIKKDKDSLKKDDSKRTVLVKNKKERNLLKSQAKDDNQDMITSPKSTPNPFIDNDPKENSKRKRTPGEDKVSGDIEYGANLVGARVKVWWPDDKQYYEGIIESFDVRKKKHKVSYTDGDEELLVLQKEKWEFVDDGTMQVEVNIDSNPSSSARSHSGKKAKRDPDKSSKQKLMDVSPKRGGSADTNKFKGTVTKSSRKHDSKSKDKTFKTTGRSEEDWESDDKSMDDVLGAASKSKENEVKAKSKTEIPKTVTKSKDKTPRSGNSSSGTGKSKSSSSKLKESSTLKGKWSGSGKTPETAKVKSANATKAGRSGKKQKRGF